MKQVRYYQSGGPEVLQVEEVAIPQPEAGQALLKVKAIDIGYVDTQMRNEGSPWGTPSFPVAPGDYVYGTVVRVGSEADESLVGQEMLGFAPVGAYAEYALVPLSLRVHPLPEIDLAPEELVTLPVAGETAYHILATSARMRPGESVLIHAAAGGIGHFTVQLARAMGAGQIIATASSPAKLDVARQLGADTLINYTEPDWTEQVMQATGGKGVDIILDVVGGQVMVDSLSLLAPLGRLIVSGAASGRIPALSSESISDLLMGLKRIEGFSSITLMQHYPSLITEGREAFRGYVEQGKVRPRIMRTFALGEVADAHRLLESRASYGKIVLLP